jgi:hypothetical protein
MFTPLLIRESEGLSCCLEGEFLLLCTCLTMITKYLLMVKLLQDVLGRTWPGGGGWLHIRNTLKREVRMKQEGTKSYCLTGNGTYSRTLAEETKHRSFLSKL